MNEYETLQRYASIVDDWDAFTAALDRPLPVCAWANPLKTTRAAVLERLRADGIDVTPVSWHPDAFLLPEGLKPGNRVEFILGLYQVQEEAALVPIEFLGIEPGMRVLDLCAAPGNKTAQIAARLQNTGTVVANDVKYQRMRPVRNTADRLGLINLVTTHYDGMNYPHRVDAYDAVLVDVPCSCEGTSRKNPSALRTDILSSIDRLARTQRALLRKAFSVVREGGRVVYSTCTYAPEENECVVQDVLDELPFEPVWVDVRLDGFKSSPGLQTWESRTFAADMERAMRVWPHHNDTGGFFVAAWDVPEKV